MTALAQRLVLASLGAFDPATTIVVGTKAISVSNSREHWTVRSRRAKKQRAIVVRMLRAARVPYPRQPLITLMRIAPRALDAHDNLRASLKETADGVAEWLGLDDGRDDIEWRYEQAKGAPKQYAIVVSIGDRADG